MCLPERNHQREARESQYHPESGMRESAGGAGSDREVFLPWGEQDKESSGENGGGQLPLLPLARGKRSKWRAVCS